MAKGDGKGHSNGRGKAYAWLVAHLDHQDEACLIWPFFRDANGYGRIGYESKMHWTHRFMCKLAHGEPPTDKHEASHNCGKGHEGCVHPKHLEWKTREANQRERYLHRRKPRMVRFKLTEEAVAEIRRLGPVTKRKDLAAMFNVSSGNIRQILIGQIWTTGKKSPGGFASESIKAARTAARSQTSSC